MASSWLRYDLNLKRASTPQLIRFVIITFLVFLCLGVISGAVSKSRVRGTFDEVRYVFELSIAHRAVLIVMVDLLNVGTVPRSLPVLAPVLGLVAMFAVRFVVRSYRWGRTASSPGTRRVIVFGAGDGGRQLVSALANDRSGAALEPVAVLDDDRAKRRTRVGAFRVGGGLDQLERVTDMTDAQVLAVAIPSMSAERMREVSHAAATLGLEVLTLPPVTEMLGQSRGSDLRELDLQDVLGRRSVQLDNAAIADAISGRRVLVTGAGGSIGSELARQIHRSGPGRLILLDRDESALHAVQMSLTGRALDDGTLALCSIRDPDAVRAIFERERNLSTCLRHGRSEFSERPPLVG
ncbi:MAG: polysaccharide biosynthesis protein [Nostocoides sp.]